MIRVIAPDEAGITAAQNVWSDFKNQMRNLHGTSSDLYPTYIYNYLFRRRFNNDNIFTKLLLEIRRQNNVNDYYMPNIITMPRTKTLTIVDSVNAANDILDTRYTLQDLRTTIDTGANQMDKNWKVMEFCARWGLIANSRNCNPPCNEPMSLKKKSDQPEGYTSIEATWKACKQSMKHLQGTTQEEMPTYLYNYMFRRAHGHEEIFQNMLFWIRQYNGF